MTMTTPGVAWIVGGGSGIGAGAALALAESGHTVVISGRRESELQQLVEAGDSLPGRIAAVPADVSTPAGPSSLLEAHRRIEAEVGTVRIAVYSAGTNVRDRYWSDTDPEDFARVLDVNLNGAVRFIHTVLPGMRAAGDGLVILVSSWAAWRFAPTAGAAYSASKTALGVLAESVNVQERQHGVRATHLCPGEVRTDILNTRPIVPSEAEQQLMLTPHDLGETVRYLVSLPARVCVNELVITPTNNSSYSAANASTTSASTTRERTP
jgi:NADP-dependent 3-hydroxy acid dehydrogenase YdfG